MATTLADFSPKRYGKLVLPALVLFGLIELSAWVCGASFGKLIKGFFDGIDFMSHMFPPDWSAFPDMLEPALQSIVTAFLGTLFGVVFSVVFALLAAANITHPVVRNISRFIIGLERSIPEIVILLTLIAAYGLGIMSGIVALTLSCIGMMGKLLGDAIEEIDHVMIESIQSVGARKLQVIWFGVIPQIVPAIISYTLFRFELNIRLSVILGAVGAGGIGYELDYAFGLLEYHRALSAVLVILVMVMGTGMLSTFVRKKIKLKGALV
ncbi:phosphonate transport system permease protein [Mucilaginibacter yixingensis]|uniref:Phosphonate transport system permease protein n=1 Tax=Mucilaginibacter yixingensis TaxID=1295612 RepID=A0A2T5J4Q6_9SPHI|nr:phosphonate ABC transporter, permease protein PhnE [Mucilaginibacter yixingensis]PTQ92648.1 phosphonate transport system permease protein [Mucilaginibacter yixingensis]